jgi:hypothetical protein
MSISYEIEPERSLIRTRCSGAVTLDEVLKHFAELRSLPSLPTPLHVFLDLTEMTTAPERDQLRAVVTEIRELGTSLRWGVLVIAAHSDLLFGMSRILGVFVESNFTNTGVFRRLGEAETWLASQLDLR